MAQRSNGRSNGAGSQKVDVRRAPVGEELTHRDILLRAAAELEARGLYDYFIVDSDFHQMEQRSWGEMLEYFDNDVMRHFLKAGRRGNFWIPAYVMSGDIQEVGRRIRPTNAWTDGPGGGSADELTLIREAMDYLGSDYASVFPTVMLNMGVNPISELQPHLARAYARWMTERILAEERRVMGMLYLPLHDAEASLKLVEDFGERPGVVGFMVTAVRYQAVQDKIYAKVWKAIEERDLVVGFHSSFNFFDRSVEQLNRFISVHTLGFPYYNMIQLVNWIVNGMPERFPGLRTMFIESGVSWIPFIMERLDSQYMMRPSEAPLLTKKPSEYIRECYFSSQPLEATHPKFLENVFDMINAESQLLYASDWPHWDFDLASRIYDLPFLTDHARRQILGENARRLFKLPPGRTREQRPLETSRTAAETAS